MLAIRLSRRGKNKEPHFRIIVQEKTLSPKKQATEILGFYQPARQPKVLEIKEDRIKHWLGVGAQPSDTVAVLLKSKGFSNMEKFIAPRDKKLKSKKEKGAAETAPAAPSAPSAPATPAQPAAEKPAATPAA